MNTDEHGTHQKSEIRNQKSTRLLGLHVRWMIRRDMPEVLRIESEAFEFPWTEEDFVRCLRARCTVGMVAECEDRVIGYKVYSLHAHRIQLLTLAVAADCRRRKKELMF